MTRYIALLRGVNVGGKNIIKMADLKAAFEARGFGNVLTYINSGNIMFDSETSDTLVLRSACEEILADGFGIKVPVCVISAGELIEALEHAPIWWNNAADAKHDAIFIIPPMTSEEIVSHVGAVKEEYEKVDYHGGVVFWSASVVTFSRTRWSKISKDKAMYGAITVRNANTALKLASLARGRINREANETKEANE